MNKKILFAIIGVPLIVLLYFFLPDIIGFFVYDLLNIDAATKLGSSLHFFIYETIKIVILIFLISMIMGVINEYLPINKIKHDLSTKKLYGFQYVLASLFGAVTPFCSCSSIPLFIGFLKGGIPLGVTFSFLITSPLVNEVAIALFLGTFGVQTTLIYVGTGIILGSIGGFVLEKMKLEHLLTDWVLEIQQNPNRDIKALNGGKISILEKLPSITAESWSIIKRVFFYVLVGIGIGAFIHGFVPDAFFEKYISSDSIFSVPLAVLIAMPIYANATSVIPIIQVLVAKGIPIGTAIAFMMGVIGLSLPEATLLKKVMKWKLIAIFFGITGFFMIISGYLFNIIL